MYAQGDLISEFPQGDMAVAGLAPFLVRSDCDPGRTMPQTHGGGSFVDFLAAVSGAFLHDELAVTQENSVLRGEQGVAFGGGH